MLLKAGVGFTVTTTFCDPLLQPLAVVVNTYVTLIGNEVVLVKVSLITPVTPLDALSLMPATNALLQLNVAPVVALVAV